MVTCIQGIASFGNGQSAINLRLTPFRIVNYKGVTGNRPIDYYQQHRMVNSDD